MTILRYFLLFLTITTVFACGERKVIVNPLITHGFEADPGGFPWHVALFHRKENKLVYKCGGALINSNTVLTAAHCVSDNSGNSLRSDLMVVQLGKHRLFVLEEHSKEVQVKRIILHNRFKRSTLTNDIAKLTLIEEVIFTNYIQPICLYNANETSIGRVENQTGTVVGWGYTHQKQETSDVLREAKMPVVPSFQCLESNRGFFGYFLSDLNFCAGFRNGTSVCNGDSGGGIYFEEKGVWKLRGLVSVGTRRGNKEHCSLVDYVLFTDVPQYLTWINEPQAVQECGIWRPRPGSLDHRMITARPGDFPWSAAILQLEGDHERFRCGGSLISARTVLTTSECVLDKNQRLLPAGNITVRLGTINFQSSLGKVYQVRKVQFQGAERQENRKPELVLVLLATKVTFDRYIQPICINRHNLASKYTFAFYAGWQDSANLSTQFLTIGKMQNNVFECVERNDAFISINGDTPLCVKNMNQTAPGMLVGGGLAVLDNGLWRLIGVVFAKQNRFTQQAESNGYLYTDVFMHSSWVTAKEQLVQFKLDCISNYTKIPGESPWHVRIYYKNFDHLSFVCGGTLISKDTIVTAAECVYNLANNTEKLVDLFRIRLPTDVRSSNQYDKEKLVFKITVHPGFNPKTKENNFALLILTSDVKFSSFVQPACLWAESHDNNNGNNVGTVLTLRNAPLEKPTQINVQLHDCFEKDKKIACGSFQDGPQTICGEDVGAGFVEEVNGISYLKAVVFTEAGYNLVNQCLIDTQYAVLTRLQTYLHWILNQVDVY